MKVAAEEAVLHVWTGPEALPILVPEEAPSAARVAGLLGRAP